MTRIQLARYCLIASAFVLAGLLLYSARGGVLPEARADMVLQKGNLTFLTTPTANNEEALFVIDNVSQRLLVYTIELRRGGQVELKVSRSLKQMFGPSGRSAGGGRPSR